jgi:hypothetical protein
MSALEQSVSVTPEYRHVEKVVTPEPSLALERTILKWYDIAPDDAPVPLAIRALARRNLRDAAHDRALGDLGDLGFVVLHRCGEDFYFLLLCTWRTGDVFFRPWPADAAHRPTFCVWELGALCHERDAWGEYLHSARDESARKTYLRSTYQGVV